MKKAEDIIELKSKEGWQVVHKDDKIISFKRNKKRSFIFQMIAGFFIPFIFLYFASMTEANAFSEQNILSAFIAGLVIVGAWRLIAFFVPAKEEVMSVRLDATGKKICPKCKKTYDDSWEKCLNDGQQLVIFKEDQEEDVIEKKSATTDDKGEVYIRIEELSKLKEKGILSQEEFEGKKKELLERI